MTDCYDYRHSVSSFVWVRFGQGSKQKGGRGSEHLWGLFRWIRGKCEEAVTDKKKSFRTPRAFVMYTPIHLLCAAWTALCCNFFLKTFTHTNPHAPSWHTSRTSSFIFNRQKKVSFFCLDLFSTAEFELLFCILYSLPYNYTTLFFIWNHGIFQFHTVPTSNCFANLLRLSSCIHL